MTGKIQLLLLVCTACFDRNAERKKITRVCTAYRAAVSNNMGAECAAYIDSASVKYYSYILSLVKNADSATVEQLRMDQKLEVLAARHTSSAQEIMKMDEKACSDTW